MTPLSAVAAEDSGTRSLDPTEAPCVSWMPCRHPTDSPVRSCHATRSAAVPRIGNGRTRNSTCSQICRVRTSPRFGRGPCERNEWLSGKGLSRRVPPQRRDSNAAVVSATVEAGSSHRTDP
ncbi:MAG: hypothetical protein MZV64_31430 [Ignavibacteriales bacterium]|nr:hypothetical protein [Ignavibacteriales bacterium]